MDNFYEQFIMPKDTTKYTILKILSYIFSALTLVLLFIFSPIALVTLILAVICYFIKGKFYVEYEYDFTNGELDIDKIIEKKKREKIKNFTMKEVQIIAKSNSDDLKYFINSDTKIERLYPKNANEETYIAVIGEGSAIDIFEFIPNEKLLNLCFKYNPRVVKR